MNNLETVRDAVIYFKGEWPCEKQAFIFHGNIGQGWRRPVSSESTRKEFNNYIDLLASNMGECKISFSEHCSNEYIRLQENKVDKISCYVCHVGAYPMQQYCGSCGHELLSELAPIQSLVYTQEMNDNDILPSVGMEFLDSGSCFPKVVRICLLVDGDGVVYKSSEAYYHSATLEECEPLPAPVELIDRKAYQFDYDSGTEGRLNVVMRYNECAGAFVFANHTFKPEHCINIKPLTVEVK